MTIRNLGFPAYGDPRAIWRAGLRSADDVDGATLSGTNTPTYDPDLGTCFHRLSALTKPIPVGYRDRFTLTYWISSSFLDQTYVPAAGLYGADTGNEFLVNFDMGTDQHVRRGVSGASITFGGSGDATLKPRCDMRGADTQVRCDFSIGHGTCDLYIDGLLAASWPWRVAHDAPGVVNINLPGSGTNAAHGPEYAYIRDVQVVPWSLEFPRNAGRSIAFIGDSFTRSGQYPQTLWQILGCPTEYYGSASTLSATTYRNGGMIPYMHGKVALAGIYPRGNRISWYGRGGAGVTDATNSLSDLVDRMLTGIADSVETMDIHGRYENRPDIVCVCIGANDPFDTDFAAWKTAYTTEIDRILAAGASKIFINTLGPYTMESGFDAYIDNVDNLNIKVFEIEREYSEVVVVDMLAALGGHWNYDPLNFGGGTPGAADRHPSTYGQRIYGQRYADAIMRHV